MTGCVVTASAALALGCGARSELTVPSRDGSGGGSAWCQWRVGASREIDNGPSLDVRLHDEQALGDGAAVCWEDSLAGAPPELLLTALDAQGRPRGPAAALSTTTGFCALAAGFGHQAAFVNVSDECVLVPLDDAGAPTGEHRPLGLSTCYGPLATPGGYTLLRNRTDPGSGAQHTDMLSVGMDGTVALRGTIATSERAVPGPLERVGTIDGGWFEVIAQGASQRLTAQRRGPDGAALADAEDLGLDRVLALQVVAAADQALVAALTGNETHYVTLSSDGRPVSPWVVGSWGALGVAQDEILRLTEPEGSGDEAMRVTSLDASGRPRGAPVAIELEADYVPQGALRPVLAVPGGALVVVLAQGDRPWQGQKIFATRLDCVR